MKSISLIICCLSFCYAGRSQIVYDSIKDSRDNHIYRTLKIGDQTWMAENLAYLPYASPQGCGPGGSKCYFVYGYTGTNLNEARDNENYKKYGALYNFEAAKEACPTGWRLPTDEEWMVLEMYLGMPESAAASFGNRGDIGKIMKSTSGWFLNGNGDNSTGLNILPCGFLNEDFFNMGVQHYHPPVKNATTHR